MVNGPPELLRLSWCWAGCVKSKQCILYVRPVKHVAIHVEQNALLSLFEKIGDVEEGRLRISGLNGSTAP